MAIVSRRFAERLLPAGDPIGQVLVRRVPPDVTVVGVVDDVFDVSLTQAPEPALYLPWAQSNNSNVPVALVIRTAALPLLLAPAVGPCSRRSTPRCRCAGCSRWRRS